MSEQATNGDELTKMKLGDLKKLCKKHNLSTSGTKVELISRLVETNSDTFTILQPGDEDKLLGEVDEPSSFELTAAASAPISVPVQKTAEHVTEVIAPSVSETTISPGSKRLSSDTTDHTTVAAKQPAVEIPVATMALSDSERLAARANRFGTSRPVVLGSLTDDKLAARARRFGLPISEEGAQSGLRVRLNQSTDVQSNMDEAERLRKRAERFGLTAVNAVTDEQRKARRLERFGATDTLSTDKSDEQAKAARALKFGLKSESEKLQQRKARFGIA